MSSTLVQFAAGTTALVPAGKTLRLLSVTLTPAAAAASVVIQDTAGSRTFLTLAAVLSGQSVTWTAGDPQGAVLGTTAALPAGGFSVVVAGAGAVASVEYAT